MSTEETEAEKETETGEQFLAKYADICIELSRELMDQNAKLDIKQTLFIISCILHNRLNTAKKLITYYPDIVNDSCSDIALCMAGNNGNTDAIEWLFSIKSSFDPDYYNASFLDACAHGHLSSAQLLQSKNPSYISLDFIKESFSKGCVRGDLELVKWLCEIEPKVVEGEDSDHAFGIACKNGRMDIVKWILPAKSHTPPIMYDAGFNIAWRNGHLELAQWLHSNNPELDMSVTPLDFCETYEAGHVEVINWLIKIKPDIIVGDNETAIFYIGCKNGLVKPAQFLIELGHKITLPVFTAAFYGSCAGGHLECAKWLVLTEPNINVNAKDNYPSRIALHNNHPEIADWINSLNEHTSEVI